MILVLVALAGCTGMDVISILQKKRQPVTGMEVVVKAEQVEEHPRVYSGFELTYIVRGKGVSRKAVERSVYLSEKKYCSVGAMLEQVAPIQSSIVLEDWMGLEEPMSRESTYAVTIELTEIELALLYHVVMDDRGEHRTVYWEEGGQRRRHYISERWLENKVFGAIAEMQPGWLSDMDQAQKRLSLYKK
jgi:putative redox protein